MADKYFPIKTNINEWIASIKEYEKYWGDENSSERKLSNQIKERKKMCTLESCRPF